MRNGKRQKGRDSDWCRSRQKVCIRGWKKRRQTTSGHTQLRHGHHKWLKADFPFRQANQSLLSVMETKVIWAWSSAFASSNHRRDVFKKSGWWGAVAQRALLYHRALFKWGILPVYRAAKGSQHFVWGLPANISFNSWRFGFEEGCDTVFIIPWCDLSGGEKSWPRRQGWKLH